MKSCDAFLVTILPPNAATERVWNFRDDIDRHYFGEIPGGQEIISLTLNWKPDARAQAKLVGRYRINIGSLLSWGYVAQTQNGGRTLRFQRTGDMIEIATARGSPALVVGRKPEPAQSGR